MSLKKYDSTYFYTEYDEKYYSPWRKSNCNQLYILKGIEKIGQKFAITDILLFNSAFAFFTMATNLVRKVVKNFKFNMAKLAEKFIDEHDKCLVENEKFLAEQEKFLGVQQKFVITIQYNQQTSHLARIAEEICFYFLTK